MPVSSRFPLGALLALCVSVARATDPAECVTQTDDAQRLACYDRLFRSAPGSAADHHGTTAAVPAEAPSGSLTGPAAIPTAEQGLSASRPRGPMTRFWELSPSENRGTFVVRTYLPNYFLPLHYSTRLNRTPYSPTHGEAPARRSYRDVEAKLQVSLRTKAVEGLLLPNADLWLAYTQRSLWQLWNELDSSPFRSTDHEPEMIYVIAMPQGLSVLPGGWQWRMVQLGFAHQSNGQSAPLSRSWNRLYVGTGLERGEFGLQLRLNNRTRETGPDDNPGLTRHVGNTELSAAWLPGKAMASLAWRTHLSDFRRGSLQLDWSYPVNSSNPDGLRWYLQAFTGYGETLLDYNHRQTSLGAGVSLFSF